MTGYNGDKDDWRIGFPNISSPVFIDRDPESKTVLCWLCSATLETPASEVIIPGEEEEEHGMDVKYTFVETFQECVIARGNSPTSRD